MIEKLVNALFPGAKLQPPLFPDLAGFKAPFRIEVAGAQADFVGPVGEDGTARCGLGLMPARLKERFNVSPDRRYPLKIRGEIAERAESRIALDEGLRFVSVPESVTLKNSFGTWSLTFAREGRDLDVSSFLYIPAQTVAAQDCGAFLEFCARVDEGLGGKLVLGGAFGR
jgi:hypothetical protein